MWEALVSGKENIDITNYSTETRNKKDLHFRLEWGEEIQNWSKAKIGRQVSGLNSAVCLSVSALCHLCRLHLNEGYEFQSYRVYVTHHMKLYK